MRSPERGLEDRRIDDAGSDVTPPSIADSGKRGGVKSACEPSLRPGRRHSADGGWRCAGEEARDLRGVVPRRVDGVGVTRRRKVQRDRLDAMQQIGVRQLVEQPAACAAIVVPDEHRLQPTGGRVRGMVSDCRTRNKTAACAGRELLGLVRVSVVRIHILRVHMHIARVHVAVQQSDGLHQQRTEPQRHGEGHTGPGCRLHAGCLEEVEIKPLA